MQAFILPLQSFHVDPDESFHGTLCDTWRSLVLKAPDRSALPPGRSRRASYQDCLASKKRQKLWYQISLMKPAYLSSQAFLPPLWFVLLIEHSPVSAPLFRLAISPVPLLLQLSSELAFPREQLSQRHAFWLAMKVLFR